ncbi:DUF4328 domain-containing protein [Rhodococcus sp. BP-332]|uniref:DUF4328 domain-containing protein n=1 Tax=Rhodococcus sp. BP-332 TaxID=2739447 RepID=UPI001C9AD90F|nr:DUF4328 domain-containing protein [Rhodococcus sp. BP-332]MBY6677453.1 DUF4328 domain-containing protein [Rhodococcus sp. BP-332]
MTAPRPVAWFQICARCTRRIDVGPSPRQWCPVCHGVLLSPVPVGQSTAPVGQWPMAVRRNFRWVASTPGSAPRRRVRRVPTPTPRYDVMPTWGLPIAPRPHPSAPESATDRLARRSTSLLTATVVLFAAAAVAELARYVVLLVSRDRLMPAAVLALSDAAVWCLSFLSLGVGLVAAVATVARVVRLRRSAYARHGLTDPRRTRTLYLGSLLPIVTLLLPGVFLTELARTSEHRLRLERLVPWWWAAWVGNWLLIAATVAWRTVDGIQAQANGVVLTAITDLVAAGVAALTLTVIRRADGRTVRGDTRTLTRWTVLPTTPVSDTTPAPEDTAPDQLADVR